MQLGVIKFGLSSAPEGDRRGFVTVTWSRDDRVFGRVECHASAIPLVACLIPCAQRIQLFRSINRPPTLDTTKTMDSDEDVRMDEDSPVVWPSAKGKGKAVDEGPEPYDLENLPW